ncbi:hypothetical protein CGCS363_v003371 [Colletotrichum siamense]|uniref:uncharacterized protein n=1 Tax=Colletotrichum siamense TaxID=690259 RepID=UPI0018732C47|nr:uncharacterized protein CGCS363_v003371 [Colletotrichum siamense]KAF5510603.1 hypothetical protein CGCS363_v003371 [Colletotrichum siamense]
MKRSDPLGEGDAQTSRPQVKRARSQTTLDQYFTRPLPNRSTPKETAQQRAGLQALPVECLDNICSYLHDENYFASLVAFALASKTCHGVAKGFLVETIKFRIEKVHDTWKSELYKNRLKIQEETFHSDVRLCSEALLRDGTFTSVRRLVLDDTRELDFVHEPGHRQYRNIWQQPTLSDFERHKDGCGFEGYLSYDDPRSFEGDEGLPDGYGYRGHHGLPEFHRNELDDDHFWAPLAALVRYGFATFVYTVRWRVPTDPLMDLTWNWLSLLVYMAYDAANASVMGHLTRLSPNLKEISMLMHRWQRYEAISWDSFRHLHEGEGKNTAASLESLRLKIMFDPLTPLVSRGALESWSTCVDFAQLRNLYLSHCPTLEGFQLLSSSDFRSLECLDLRVTKKYRDPGEPADLEQTEEALRMAVQQFVGGLSSQLSTLRITGESRFYEFPAGLGHTLRTLDLTKGTAEPLTIGDVEEISRLSPLIEHLGLKIARTKGDAGEVATYRALGRFSNLRSLQIFLNVTMPYITSSMLRELDLYEKIEEEYPDIFSWLPPFCNAEEEDRELADTVHQLLNYHGMSICNQSDMDDRESVYSPYKKELVEDFLVNMAVDEKLARSIFGVISGAAASRSKSMLQSLKLITTGYEDFNIVEERLWEYQVPWKTGWTVERDPTNLSKTIVRADKPGKWPGTSPDVLLDYRAGGLDLVLRSLWKIRAEDSGEKMDPKNNIGPYGQKLDRYAELNTKFGARGKLDWESFPLKLNA